MDLQSAQAVVFDEAKLAELIMKMLIRERVVPTRAARISWLILGGIGLDSPPLG